MIYIDHYDSPVGRLILASDGDALTGLWMEDQKYFSEDGKGHRQEWDDPMTQSEPALPIFQEAKAWLDVYFQGKDPGTVPPVKLEGTSFRMDVWDILQQIPYGETTTYGEIAQKLAQKRGLKRMSAQAVGGAVGHNPIGIIVPCHRVLGSDRSLTGYAGGLDKKRKLLELEGIVYKE